MTEHLVNVTFRIPLPPWWRPFKRQRAKDTREAVRDLADEMWENGGRERFREACRQFLLFGKPFVEEESA